MIKKIDIIVGSLASNTISVHFNNCNGTFTSRIIFPFSFPLKNVKAVDINLDNVEYTIKRMEYLFH
jgi:hypothetical protein